MKKYFFILILYPRFWYILCVICCTESLLIALFVCRHLCDRMKGNISRYIKQHKIRIKIIVVGWHFRKQWKHFTRITWEGEKIWRDNVKIRSSDLRMRRFGLLRPNRDSVRGYNKVRELDIRGVVHYEFVPTGQTVNQVYYLEVLKRLREKVRRKRPGLFVSISWILHHDNAPAHTALSVREFLATKQITCVGTPCLFTGSSLQWLFSVREGKGNIERKAFWWHWWHQE